MMTQDEVAGIYAKITAPLLTALRDAARTIVPAYEDQGVHLIETGQDQEGNVIPSGNFVITREGPNNSTWSMTIGFINGGEFNDSINFDVPKGKFPPMVIPIRLSWLGNDQWGRRQNQDVPLPQFELARNTISWRGRTWSPVAQVDSDWIVSTLLTGWVLHDSPGAAEEARQSVPGARWERISELRRWGQNEVWRVRDLQDQSAPHRAMKMLRWRKGPDSTAYKRLVREIEIARQIGQKNPNIIEVIDYGVPQEGDEWTPFYVMPLAETTLTKATDFEGNLEAVLNLGTKLAIALAAAHEQGVIHRDVKPDNVLLYGPERRPVLADFGICFLVTEEGSRLTGSEANTVGPANYVAPELLGGKADLATIDPRVDVYSLGKTLYFALSGGDELPREYHTQARYDLRKKYDDPRMAHFYGLLERMVVEDPQRRFPSMAACVDAFTRALTNIKKSVPYTTGMYGGIITPVERAEELTALLSNSTGLARTDAIRDAIAESRRIVETTVNGLTRPDGRPAGQDAVTHAAAEAAERLMAVGIPLVTAGDTGGFERWLDEIVAPLLPDGTGGVSEVSNARRAASVLAFHGVAVVAWDKERFSLLRTMLKTYDEHASPFAHLRIFGGSADKSWAWIGDTLKRSSILARAQPQLQGSFDESLVIVAGLGALLGLLSLKPEALATAVPDAGNPRIVLLPAFMPQASNWIENLPDLLRRSPALERTVAQELFRATTPTQLRDDCKRITPKLRRVVAWTASQLGRDTGWIGEIPEEGSWWKWCGGGVAAERR